MARNIASAAELRAQLPTMEEHLFQGVLFLRINALYTSGLRTQVDESVEGAKNIIGPTAAMLWEDAGTASKHFPLLPRTFIDELREDLHKLLPANMQTLPLILKRLAEQFQSIAIRPNNGDQNYLNPAIEVSDKATSFLKENSEAWTWMLCYSASMRESRFRRGMKEDLRMALELATKAHQAMHKQDRHYEDCLVLLATIHGHLYELRPEFMYLEAGLRFSTEAVQAGNISRRTDQEWISLILTHSNLLAMKSIREHDSKCLDEAIQSLDEAVILQPQDRSLRASLSYNLGRRHLERFQRYGRSNELDLVNALKYHHRAVTLCLRNHSGRGQYLNGLAIVYIERYDRFLDWDDLAKAFDIATQALTASDEPLEQHSNSLMLAAYSLEKAVEANDVSKFNSSISLYERVMSQSGLPLRAKVMAAMAAGKLYVSRKRMKDARRAFVCAITFVEERNNQIISLDDLQYILDATGGLSALAAALTLEASGEPWEALAVLEKGRGSIINTSIGRRTDLVELEERNPEVYREYMFLRSSLFEKSSQNDNRSAWPELKRNIELLDIVKQRKDKARLEEIETEWEITSWNPPDGAQHFQNLAEFGPIVAFNATGIRSDAFIVTSTEVKALSLGIKYEDLQRYTNFLDGPQAITEGPESTRLCRNEELQGFLQWLWTNAVQPVLNALDFLSPSSTGNLPRIWWVTSGLLGLAPLHAAGRKGSRTKHTHNYVVSSYIPTIKALARARQTSANVHPHENNTLMVTMPQTTGFNALKTERDAEAVKASLMSRGYKLEILETPSKYQVLNKLSNISTVYFACHGEVDRINPANSGLLLKQGVDEMPERLTFRDLARHNSKSAKMVCLLACSTAKNEHERLTDEMLHIVSGFQVSGFPHVIGSLWAVDDDIANDLAKAFAKRISESDGSDAAIARALHDSVNTKRLVKRGVNSDVLGWAPFVHFGC